MPGTTAAGNVYTKKFTLTADQAATNVTSFAYNLDEINYKLSDIPAGETSKEFTYTVTESDQTMAGVSSVDSTSYTVTVTIRDKGDGSLDVVKSNNYDILNFTNAYDASTKAIIKGKKVVTNGRGDNHLAGYSFTLTAADGIPMPSSDTTVTSDSNGRFQFGGITYDVADVKKGDVKGTEPNRVYTKEYIYAVIEQLPDLNVPATDDETAAGYAIRNGIKYDISPKTVTVTVTYNETTGVMSTDVKPSDNEFIITNEKLGELQITKNLQNNGLNSGKGTFYYALYAEEYIASADPAQIPVRTGMISIDDSDNGTKTVTENNIPYGTYYVYELTGQNGTPVVSGDNGVNEVINNTVYKVTGSGITAIDVDAEAGKATITNNHELTTASTSKIWVNGSVQDWDENVTSIILDLSRYQENASDPDSSFGTSGKVQIVVTKSGNTYNASLASGNSLPAGATMENVEVLEKPIRYLIKISGLEKYYIDINGEAKPYSYRFTEEPVSGASYKAVTYGIISNSTYSTDGGYSYADGSSIMNSAIINTPEEAVSLPATGGTGTYPFAVGGLIFLAFSAMVFVLIKRRRI